MNPRVVSIPNFESQFSLHAKRSKIKITFMTVSLKKHDVLQTAPNIDILYIVRKYFSPRVWNWDHYFKISLRLARINCQSFVILHRKVCWRSGHFRREQRVPLRWGGLEELVGTLNHFQKWPETGVLTSSLSLSITCVHHFQWRHFTANRVGPSYFSVFYFSSTGACSTIGRC